MIIKKACIHGKLKNPGEFCPGDVSCNEAETSCGECTNDTQICINDETDPYNPVGTLYNCKEGKRVLFKKCSDVSCNSSMSGCGKCLDGTIQDGKTCKSGTFE